MKKFGFLLPITQLLIHPIASAIAKAKTFEVGSQTQMALWPLTEGGYIFLL